VRAVLVSMGKDPDLANSPDTPDPPDLPDPQDTTGQTLQVLELTASRLEAALEDIRAEIQRLKQQ